MTTTAPTVVRLSSPSDLAAAIPHLLGFVPTESLVLILLGREPGARRPRVRLTVRIDLPDPSSVGPAMQVVREAAEDSDADEAVAIVITEAAPEPGEHRPRTDLADAIDAALGPLLLDMLVLQSGTVASYLCRDTACCPQPVRPDHGGGLAIAAAHVAAGRAVLPGRGDVVALVAAPAGGTPDPVAAELVRVRPPSRRRDAADVRMVNDLVRRWGGGDGSLTDAEVARLALGCERPAVADAIVSRALDDDASVLVAVLSAASRRVGPPDDAALSMLLALTAYLDGSGILAVAALDRVLDRPEGQLLGRLVTGWIDAMVSPAQARRQLRQRGLGSKVADGDATGAADAIDPG